MFNIGADVDLVIIDVKMFVNTDDYAKFNREVDDFGRVRDRI